MGTLALVAALVVTAAGAAGGQAALVLVVEGGGRSLAREPVRPGARLVLAYVHSSERVLVRGTLAVEADGSLRVVETAFGGPGPGLPETGPVRIAGGMIVHAVASAPLEELRLRVALLTRHALRVPSGRTLDLSGALAAGAIVRIRVERGRSAGFGAARTAPGLSQGPTGHAREMGR